MALIPLKRSGERMIPLAAEQICPLLAGVPARLRRGPAPVTLTVPSAPPGIVGSMMALHPGAGRPSAWFIHCF